jgi:F0F1-type ATP synthase assembly protein I
MADRQPPRGTRKSPGSGGEPNVWVLAGSGLELGAIVVVMALLGRWLDTKFGTGPWMVIGGLAIGAIGGIYNLWRVGKRFFE